MVIFNSYVKLPEGNHFKVFPIFFTLPTPSPPIPCALHRRNHPELRAASRFEGLTLQADGLGTERTGEFSKHPKVADFSRGCDGKYGNIMEIYGICHGNISWKISWEYDGKYHGKYDGKYDGNYGNMMGNLMDWWTWPSYSHQNQLYEYVIRDFCKWGSQSPTIPNRHMYGLGLPFVVPSAKHTKSYRKSPFLIDKPSILWAMAPITMLVYQRVYSHWTIAASVSILICCVYRRVSVPDFWKTPQVSKLRIYLW